MILVAIGHFACLLATVAPASEVVQYLPSIQQRWDASDIVCTGKATALSRTGRMQYIAGSDRDELSAHAVFERSFKGELRERAQIRVIGYDLVSAKQTAGGDWLPDRLGAAQVRTFDRQAEARRLGLLKNTEAQEIEVCASVHLSFDELQSMHLAFDQAVAPGSVRAACMAYWISQEARAEAAKCAVFGLFKPLCCFCE